MAYSRLLLSACLKNAGAYKVAWRTLASEAPSCYGSADSKDLSDPPPWLILRVYRNKKGKWELTPAGEDLDKKTNGKLKYYVDRLTNKYTVGSSIMVTSVDIYEVVSLACCGPKDAGVNNVEGINEMKENLRICYGGARSAFEEMYIQDRDAVYEKGITAEDRKNANEGYILSYWHVTKDFDYDSSWFENSWNVGTVAQNWARYLSSMPPNKMTPVGVFEEAKSCISRAIKNTTINKYDKTSKEVKDMHAFLAVAQGSSVPPLLLECIYKGKKDAPYVLIVANGVTSDSGGLCLKNRDDILKNSGMTGAAAALGTMLAVAKLELALNVVLLVPLCENMISGHCLKVGDVVPTLQGKKVKIEDTGLEGSLMLADVLTYGQKQFKPKYVMSVASLTPGITKATGGGCYGCFTKNDELWKIAYEAGVETGDRPWRFPIWDYYGNQITDDSAIFNLKNRGSGIASHCLGAAFLEKFVTCANWLHYDVTGVGKMARGETPTYLNPRLMTGRPTRALLETIKVFEKKTGEFGEVSPFCNETNI